MNSILLVGATGGLGQIVVSELIAQQSQFKRVGVLVDATRAANQDKQAYLASIRESGIEVILAHDYSDPTVYQGFDCLMSFLGNHAFRNQPSIFTAALESGIRHFYPSEYGSDLTVGSNWTQRYYRYKVITRKFLENKGQKHTDLGWTYFTNGLLAEWAILGVFGVDNKNRKARIYGSPQGSQSMLAERDFVKYIVATLKEPMNQANGGHRRTYRISGETMTWETYFRTLEQVRGVKYNVEYLHPGLGKLEVEEAARQGDIDRELFASLQLIGGLGGSILPTPWDNRRFPEIQVTPVAKAWSDAFENPRWRMMYGLE